MLNKIIGGSLLIIGTSIGGGMLALPIATASGGYLHAFWLFLGAWLITLIGAFLILEFNLWLPERTNMISMARTTLGPAGQIITWLSYLILLYALLAAYIAGGTDLLDTFFQKVLNFSTPHWIDSILFVLLFGGIVHCGIFFIDWTNRGLMTIKLVAFLLLTIFIFPHIDLPHLEGGKFTLLTGAIMVIITSFGYATVIPSLRAYFKSDIKSLRLTIAIGSSIPLICYLLWNISVQGTVDKTKLISMASSDHSISDLTRILSQVVKTNIVFDAAHVFTTICVTTSFLGVSLCLSDFLADGIHAKHNLKDRWLVTLSTFAPPLLIVVFFPGIFIEALNYAGIICVILLMLLPALMTWSGRYVKKIATGYELIGGKFLVGFEILISIILIAVAVYQVF